MSPIQICWKILLLYFLTRVYQLQENVMVIHDFNYEDLDNVFLCLLQSIIAKYLTGVKGSRDQGVSVNLHLFSDYDNEV